jgi:ubiquinone/menaquinone biosynthesis C-methylase UbiE
VDISAPMLARARRLSHEAGLRNLTFVQADAQDHRFPHEYFDIGISRFGTMFCTDPSPRSPTSRVRCGPGRDWSK